jgi:Holliday junction resolvase
MKNSLGIDIEKTEKQLNDRRKTEQQICSRKNIVFKLPLPVSLNDLYEINANGKGLRLSAQAKEYKSICTAELLKAKISQKFVKGERIEVYAHFYPKKTRGRGRDLDNFFKLLFDVLTKNGIWYDDSQVVHINTWKHKPVIITVMSLSIYVLKSRIIKELLIIRIIIVIYTNDK